MSLCNSLIEQRPKTNLWWTRSIFCLPFSLNKMFVRKSNSKVHVIFKYTIENIKVSTFAANGGKRQFVPRDCSLLLHKKIRSFTTVLLIKNVLDCFYMLIAHFQNFFKVESDVCRKRFFNLYRDLFSSEKTNGFDKTGTNVWCVILWFSVIISAVMQEQFLSQERGIEIELEHIFTREQNNSHSVQRVQPPIKASQLAKVVSAKSNFVDSWSSFMCTYNLKKGREPE